MRFLCLYKPAKPEGTPPTEEDMARMGAFIQESAQSGGLLAAEGCAPSKFGARVSLNGSGFTVKDGPFTESKELIGGLAILRADSKDEAIAYVKRFMEFAGAGEMEVRLLFENPADAPQH
jgi:hypothetical protein